MTTTEIPRTPEERKLYCITVQFGGNPRVSYARGLFHDEAVIMRDYATKRGYKNAKIHPQDEFHGPRVAKDAATSSGESG